MDRTAADILHNMTCKKPHPTNYDYFCEFRDVSMPEALKQLYDLCVAALPKKYDSEEAKLLGTEEYNEAIDQATAALQSVFQIKEDE